jgi:hypothetical protein
LKTFDKKVGGVFRNNLKRRIRVAAETQPGKEKKSTIYSGRRIGVGKDPKSFQFKDK